MAKKETASFSQFVAALRKSSTEEDVKNIYAQHFNVRYDTAIRHDLYTPQVFFEFKFDKNFTNLRARAAILAQTLYYIHRLKYGYSDRPIPPLLALADRNEAVLTETTLWREFYTDTAGQYDWDLAPSMPDPRLVAALAETEEVRNLHIFKVIDQHEYTVFAEKLRTALDRQLSLLMADKKIITEENFEEVFGYWNKIFGDSVRNGQKTSRYFVCDIQTGRSFYRPEESRVYFDFGQGDIKAKKIFAKDYEYFWSLYERVTDPELIRAILVKIDRLTDETMRRFHGEFFTPLKFAKKGLDYLDKTLGSDWHHSGEYRLWDMAAGTGNLEYHLHADALPYCYFSTLYQEDVEHCRRLFPQAAVFQYDYLNDDVGNLFLDGQLPFGLTWKLPEKLLADLQNPALKWIVLINPPFATSQTAGFSGGSKKDVSDTLIRKVMHRENLGEVSRELFAQFLFRIKQEFKGKTAHLGLFSTLKYVNANNDQKFRDTVFQFEFERGFVFSSANFSGTKKTNAFPIGFLIWNLGKNLKIENQEIALDVFDTEVEKIGVKNFTSEHRQNFLSKWIDRPAATIIFPPFGSAINVKEANKDVRDRIAPGFLASLMCNGNDIQHSNNTALLSGPYASAGALSVTAENFEQAMVVHAVRRIPKADWLNDRDQFMQPEGDLTEEFMQDCTVWNLFSGSNQTVALRQVKYQKQTYQIDNQFFPFLKSDLKTWPTADRDLSDSLAAGEDRFVAKWLVGRSFSEEQAVLEAGRAVWQFYFAHLNALNTPKFKIETWDAGWWQVRSALAEQHLGTEPLTALKAAHERLKAKLLPQIYSYKFLS